MVNDEVKIKVKQMIQESPYKGKKNYNEQKNKEEFLIIKCNQQKDILNRFADFIGNNFTINY